MNQPIIIQPSPALLAFAAKLVITPTTLVELITTEITDHPHPGVEAWLRQRCCTRNNPGTQIAELESTARNAQRNELLPEIALAKAVRAASKLQRLD